MSVKSIKIIINSYKNRCVVYLMVSLSLDSDKLAHQHGLIRTYAGAP